MCFIFRTHFGLVKVDFNDVERTRTPKASYLYFKNVVLTSQLSVNTNRQTPSPEL